MTGYGLYAIGFHGKCVGIIEVVVCRSLLINVNPFDGVEVDAFLPKL